MFSSHITHIYMYITYICFLPPHHHTINIHNKSIKMMTPSKEKIWIICNSLTLLHHAHSVAEYSQPQQVSKARECLFSLLCVCTYVGGWAWGMFLCQTKWNHMRMWVYRCVRLCLCENKKVSKEMGKMTIRMEYKWNDARE